MVVKNPYALCSSLYKIVASKEGYVVEIWDHFTKVGGWDPRFLRSFSYQVLGLVYGFISLVQEKRLCP